jgi:hypothetical protein
LFLFHTSVFNGAFYIVGLCSSAEIPKEIP